MFKERRNEEDALSATAYSSLPYPENQLMSLAHSLLARRVIDEAELERNGSAASAPDCNPDLVTPFSRGRG